MNDKITEIKEALAAATSGPWEATNLGTINITKDYRYEDRNHRANWIAEMDDENEKQHDDAHLIAKSPEYITYLLQLVETQHKALEWYASNWNHDVELEDIGLTPMQIDKGQKAREVLSII